MIDWRAVGARVGRALGELCEPVIGDRVRAHYAAAYGVCRRCAAVLTGHSPEQVCEGCHVDEALGAAGPRDAVDA